jgi:hypothetical protein
VVKPARRQLVAGEVVKRGHRHLRARRPVLPLLRSLPLRRLLLLLLLLGPLPLPLLPVQPYALHER